MAAPLSGDGGIDNGNASSLTHLNLRAHVVERLAAEGIHSLEDWRRLGKRRLQIFGLTTSIAKMLDAAARRVTAP
ncbi:MAG: hypothetical protein ACRDFS_01250 [Chloroflexota bacterium]